MNKLYKLAFLASTVALSLGIASPVLAIDGSSDVTPNTNTTKPRQGTESDKQASTERLTETKLKICRMRETSINKKMAQIAQRGAKHIEVINKIAERTQAFYIKSGKTLSNYDSLLADVNAKKTTAQSAVEIVKNNSLSFKCDGSDPKGAGASFQASLKQEKEAIQAYKTAVKNLIVGVKSVQATSSADKEGSQ